MNLSKASRIFSKVRAQFTFQFFSVIAFLVIATVIGCGGGGGGSSSGSNSVSFSYVQGAGNPASQTFTLNSADSSAQPFTITSTAPAWLNITPSSGTTPQSIQVTVTPSGLTPGTYTATVQFQIGSGTPVTKSYTINLTVQGNYAGACIGSYNPNYGSAIISSTNANVGGNLLKWTHFPVTVYFVRDSHWTQALEDNAWTGFVTWNAITGATYNKTTTATGADITVSFKSNLGAGILGITTDSYYPDSVVPKSGTISSATLDLLDNQMASDLQQTAAHEFGHALGISGHSPDRADLMYYAQLVTSPLTPTTQDKNTLDAIYCGSYVTTSPQVSGRAPLQKVTIIN